jgi:hypothetical protein
MAHHDPESGILRLFKTILSTLNISHILLTLFFGQVEAIGLKLCRRVQHQWHDVRIQFHKNMLICSKLDEGDTQTDK